MELHLYKKTNSGVASYIITPLFELNSIQLNMGELLLCHGGDT
jgi:hypothetical protein